MTGLGSRLAATTAAGPRFGKTALLYAEGAAMLHTGS
jgi:hypothetical protein